MKKNFFRKLICVFLITSLLFVQNGFFLRARAQQAGSWGKAADLSDLIIANSIQTMEEKALRTFEEAMIASLKKMAVKLVMDRVRALILGQSGGGSRIINDYEDYIYGNSERVAKGAVRDFFSSINQSASSATRKMYRDIEKAVTSEISPTFDSLKPQTDARLGGDTSNMFNRSKGGGISTFYLFLHNDVDNIVGARLAVQERINELKRRQTEVYKQKLATGAGFSPIEDANGLVALPGKIVADIESFVETMELRSLVNADKLAEVIGGTAAMMVTQILQSGIDKTMKPIDNQLKNINKSVKGGIDKVQKDIYKGIEFDGK